MSNPSSTSTTSSARVVMAWLLVTIPLGWGIYQSLMKSVPLFQRTVDRQPLPGPPSVKRIRIEEPRPQQRRLESQSPREAQ